MNPLKRDEFLKINPMGAVPALVDGDVVVSDSLAIIMVSIISIINQEPHYLV